MKKDLLLIVGLIVCWATWAIAGGYLTKMAFVNSDPISEIVCPPLYVVMNLGIAWITVQVIRATVSK